MFYLDEMDTDDSEIYNYDRSSFFRLLQSPKYRLKYEFIQQQQGLVVCPLKLKLNSRQIKQSESVIESHLFVPSPFYKNHYIPLNSLSSLSLLNPISIQNNSLPLDHSQQISLILNDLNDKTNELTLMNGSRQICKNVKLLNTQTAYNDNCKTYKILIVNKELFFKPNNNNHSSELNSTKRQTLKVNNEDIEEKCEELDTEQQALDDKISSIHENFHKKSLEAQFTASYDRKSVHSFDHIPQFHIEIQRSWKQLYFVIRVM